MSDDQNDDVPEEVEAPDLVVCTESYSEQEREISSDESK